jgi:hypothetical protein
MEGHDIAICQPLHTVQTVALLRKEPMDRRRLDWWGESGGVNVQSSTMAASFDLCFQQLG